MEVEPSRHLCRSLNQITWIDCIIIPWLITSFVCFPLTALPAYPRSIADQSATTGTRGNMGRVDFVDAVFADVRRRSVNSESTLSHTSYKVFNYLFLSLSDGVFNLQLLRTLLCIFWNDVFPHLILGSRRYMLPLRCVEIAAPFSWRRRLLFAWYCVGGPAVFVPSCSLNKNDWKPRPIWSAGSYKRARVNTRLLGFPMTEWPGHSSQEKNAVSLLILIWKLGNRRTTTATSATPK